MDQLIVLKGVRVHSASVFREKDRLGVDDNKIWYNKRGGEKAEKEKQSNYQLGLEVV